MRPTTPKQPTDIFSSLLTYTRETCNYICTKIPECLHVLYVSSNRTCDLYQAISVEVKQQELEGLKMNPAALVVG